MVFNKESPLFKKLVDIGVQTAREKGLGDGGEPSNSTKIWRRQVLPVEAVVFQVGSDYAWVLRVREKLTVVEEGTEKSFRMAALCAELAELRYYTNAAQAGV